MNPENFHHCTGSKKKVILTLLTVLIVFFIVLVFSTGMDVVNKVKEGKYIGQDVERKNSITISATGEIYARPDLGVITFSVINEAKIVTEAMAENTDRMNRVISAIKKQGVEDKDIKTTSFNIYPRYEYTERGYGERTIAGYEVTQRLQVKIRDLEKVGTIIEKATNAGANDVGGLQLTIDSQDELKEQARKQAIDKAKTKAQELTSQLGVKLGKITSFSESSYIPYYGGERLYMEGLSGVADVTPDIQTGENKISVSVNIIYEIY